MCDQRSGCYPIIIRLLSDYYPTIIWLSSGLLNTTKKTATCTCLWKTFVCLLCFVLWKFMCSCVVCSCLYHVHRLFCDIGCCLVVCAFAFLCSLMFVVFLIHCWFDAAECRDLNAFQCNWACVSFNVVAFFLFFVNVHLFVCWLQLLAVGLYC